MSASLGTVDKRAFLDRHGRRAKAGRSDVAEALSDYYGDSRIDGIGAYRVCVDARDALTSIATRSEWLDLACPLTPEHDRLMLARSSGDRSVEMDDFAAKYAVRRLAEVAAFDVRLTDAPTTYPYPETYAIADEEAFDDCLVEMRRNLRLIPVPTVRIPFRR